MFFEKKELKKRKQNEVSVVMSSDDNFAPYLGVTIKSIIENSSKKAEYTIYILDGGIFQINKKLLNNLQTDNVKIKFININSYMQNTNKDIFYTYGYFKIPTYYRFFIPIIFKNFEKVIYCDCDGIFTEDIAKLNDIDIKNYMLGAVKDTFVNFLLTKPSKISYFKDTLKLQKPENYFQAGVLVLNIKELCKNDFTDKCLETLDLIKKPKYLDQCVLNVVCQGKVFFLDGSWNVESPVINGVNNSNKDEKLPDELCKTFLKAYNNPKFIHFCGENKPWNTPNMENSEKFWEYAKKTQFYDGIINQNKPKNKEKDDKEKSFFIKILSVIFLVKNLNCAKHITKKKITILGISFSFSINRPKIISKLLTMCILNKNKRKQKREEIYEHLKYKTGKRKKEIDFIENQVKKHKYVYAIVSLNWDCPLHQRPHQRAKCFAKEKGIFLYAEANKDKIIFRKEGNIIFFDKDYLFHFSPKVSKKIYLIVPNVEKFLSMQTCKKLRNRGINLIYDYIDDFSDLILRNNKTQVELFDNLEQIDFCLFSATAKSLYNQLVSRFGKENVILNPNGVNVEDFKADEPPFLYPDMKKVIDYRKDAPIVGYYGALAEWLDWELLNEVHKKRPQYNFVYIGVRYDKSIEKLKPADNVFVLPQKPYLEIYKYVNSFNCCIIPFKNGDIATATNPIKLFEYMSMKKTVVCTKDLLECYGYDGILIADGSEDFAAKLDEAIALGNDENIKNKLYLTALENTWTKRVLDLDEKICEIRKKSI